ncbi:MAG TPA: tripartite tricarboxylate transporter substrate binding protein [Xanthobacteraceae bacterium]
MTFALRANGRDGASTCVTHTGSNIFRYRCRARADLIAAVAAALAPLPAQAQSYPSRLIKVVLPYTAGSPNDVIARFFTPYLSAQLGQPVVVENRAGGGTSIGTKAVASAEADGYTLLLSNTPTHVIAALGNPSINYDPLKDFAPVATIASSSLVLVIAPTVPAYSVPELVAYAKAHPGKLNFGFGQGTLPHLAGELFKSVTGTNIVSIPYRGGSQAISDLLGGRIHMNFGAGSTLLPLIREGKLRPLAVTSPSRLPEQPEVPTMAEAGLPAMTVVTHYGILAPATTASAVVATLNMAVNRALSPDALKTDMLRIGFDPVGGSARDFAALIASDRQKWAPIVKMTGFQIE